jgi:hypothetical protein
LKDLENQVTITQDLVQSNAPRWQLENGVNVLKRIHHDLIDSFSNSGGARVSVFTLFGDKMRMDDILMYSKNVIYNLSAIIQNR